MNLKSWFFIIVLFWVSFSKLIPFVDYQINYAYIVAELCEQREMLDNTCNGQCYLSKKLAENTRKAAEMQLVQVNWELLHHLHLINTDFQQEFISLNYAEHPKSFIKKSIIDPPYLPPEKMLI